MEASLLESSIEDANDLPELPAEFVYEEELSDVTRSVGPDNENTTCDMDRVSDVWDMLVIRETDDIDRHLLPSCPSPLRPRLRVPGPRYVAPKCIPPRCVL